MKNRKPMFIAAALLGAVAASFATLDSRTVEVPVVGTAYTNTVTTPMRGRIESVQITVPTGATGTVSVVASDGQTIFSKASMTASGIFRVRVPVHTTAGVAHAATATDGTNAVSNAVLDRPAVVGTLAARVISESVTTNSWFISLIYER